MSSEVSFEVAVPAVVVAGVVVGGTYAAIALGSAVKEGLDWIYDGIADEINKQREAELARRREFEQHRAALGAAATTHQQELRAAAGTLADAQSPEQSEAEAQAARAELQLLLVANTHDRSRLQTELQEILAAMRGAATLDSTLRPRLQRLRDQIEQAVASPRSGAAGSSSPDLRLFAARLRELLETSPLAKLAEIHVACTSALAAVKSLEELAAKEPQLAHQQLIALEHRVSDLFKQAHKRERERAATRARNHEEALVIRAVALAVLRMSPVESLRTEARTLLEQLEDDLRRGAASLAHRSKQAAELELRLRKAIRERDVIAALLESARELGYEATELPAAEAVPAFLVRLSQEIGVHYAATKDGKFTAELVHTVSAGASSHPGELSPAAVEQHEQKACGFADLVIAKARRSGYQIKSQTRRKARSGKFQTFVMPASARFPHRDDEEDSGREQHVMRNPGDES